MIKKLFYKKKCFLLITTFFVFIAIEAQTINKPLLQFTDVCANASLNFNLSFGLNAASSFQTSNVFTVELSNALGSFTTPTVLATSSTVTSPVVVQFQFPSTLVSGLNYKIRIKSSTPAVISPSSDAFPAQFLSHNQSYTINNNIFSQSFCQGSTYILSIDNNIYSPRQYPQLSYIWYKDNVEITGETGISINITQPGSYRVVTDYGTCPTDSYSNFVNMTTVPAQTLNITSQNNETVLCSTSGILLTSGSISNTYIYEWYKNNVAITGTNNPTYTATQVGNYFLKIANNACITPSNIIEITQEDFSVSISPSTTIIPGQTATINCTTNAINPIFTWYKDNVLLNGEVQAQITVTLSGVYKVVVKQNSPCISEKEISMTISHPTSYNLAIGYLGNYTDCENTDVTLKLNSFTANGTNVLTSGATINYQWYKNLAAISGETTNTLTISNYSQNGAYTLKATLPNGDSYTSNEKIVRIKFTETVSISSDKVYLCSTNPSAMLRPTVFNDLFVYTWYKVGSNDNIGNTQILTVTESGEYYLKLSFQGCYTLSNSISIKKVIESLLVTNYGTEIEINEGQEVTIIASGAESYKWIVVGEITNLTASYIVNTPKTILLEATFGDCKLEKTFIVTLKTNPVEPPKTNNEYITNTITPNNDGANDTWILPEEYSYQNNIEVVIFNSRNDILYQSKNYLNDWPKNEEINNTVYYFKILKDDTVLEKGTISVIK